MTETVEKSSVVEAMTLIDRGLGEFAERELLSAAEVSDLLLDVRSALVKSEPINFAN